MIFYFRVNAIIDFYMKMCTNKSDDLDIIQLSWHWHLKMSSSQDTQLVNVYYFAVWKCDMCFSIMVPMASWCCSSVAATSLLCCTWVNTPSAWWWLHPFFVHKVIEILLWNYSIKQIYVSWLFLIGFPCFTCLHLYALHMQCNIALLTICLEWHIS